MRATGSITLAIVLLAVSASAQLSAMTANMTTNCQTAAASLLTSDFGNCANVLSLVSVVSTTGSVVTPLNTWINGVCTSSPCSNSTVSAAASTIQSGCASDIASGSAAAITLNIIVSDYSDVRGLMCLQATSNSSYCVTDTLNNIQTATGTNLTVSQLTGMFEGGNNFVSMLNNVPSGAYCTDCGHALTTKAAALSANGSSSASSTVTSAMSSKCGSSFADGQIPSTVKEASAASSKGASSGAAAALPAGSWKLGAVLAGATVFGLSAVLA